MDTIAVGSKMIPETPVAVTPAWVNAGDDFTDHASANHPSANTPDSVLYQ